MADLQTPKARDIISRFQRVIARNSLKYKNLTDETICQALIDALNYGLPKYLGSEYQEFFAYINSQGELKIEVVSNSGGRASYYYFDPSFLSEYKLVRILREFQRYLNMAENKALYKKLKSLRNGLINGDIVKYIENEKEPHKSFAVVEFLTDEGERVTAFCNMRYLKENDRTGKLDFESRLFYVRNIILHDDSKLEIQLSNRSKKIVELLVKKYLQEYEYPVEEFQMKCVSRIPGKFSQLVVLNNKIDKDVILSAQDELREGKSKEIIRVINIDDKVDLAKFRRNLLSYEDLIKNYDVRLKEKLKELKRKRARKKASR